jgi:hypothetical protein
MDELIKGRHFLTEITILYNNTRKEFYERSVRIYSFSTIARMDYVNNQVN